MKIISKFIGGFIEGVATVFKYPLVRHLIAGTAIAVGLYFMSIRPLESQNKALREDYRELVVEQNKLINALSKKATYHIENSVDVKKNKRGSNINLIPENTMTTVNIDTVGDTIKLEVDTVPKKKHSNWFKRMWDKVKF